MDGWEGETSYAEAAGDKGGGADAKVGYGG